jgi:quercetin dioxygenase-like cupin family protein
MEYLRKVDFEAFAPDRFSWQVLAETERSIIVIVRQPANGNARGPTPHYHLADQVFYMLEGAIDIELDGVKHRAEQDSTIFIPAGTVHSHVPVRDELHLDIISPAPTRGMPLGRFIDQDQSMFPEMPDNPHSPTIRVEPGKPRSIGWVKTAADTPLQPTHVPGFDVRTIVNRKVGSEHIFINAAVVQPGPGPGWHIHEFDQFYYVMEGVLTVEIANKRYEVQPHQFMVIPAGVPHRNWNNGKIPERHLAIIQPQPPEGAPLDYDVKFEVTGAAV